MVVQMNHGSIPMNKLASITWIAYRLPMLASIECRLLFILLSGHQCLGRGEWRPIDSLVGFLKYKQGNASITTPPNPYTHLAITHTYTHRPNWRVTVLFSLSYSSSA